MKENDFYYFKDVLFGLRKMYLDFYTKLNELKKSIRLDPKYEDIYFYINKDFAESKPKIELSFRKKQNFVTKTICKIKGIYTGKDENLYFVTLEKLDDKYIFKDTLNIININIKCEYDNFEELDKKITSILNLDFCNYMFSEYNVNRDGMFLLDYDSINIEPNCLEFFCWNRIKNNDEYLRCNYDISHDIIELYIGKKNKYLVEKYIDYIFNYKIPKSSFSEYMRSCIEVGNTFNKKIQFSQNIKKGAGKFKINENEEYILLIKV